MTLLVVTYCDFSQTLKKTCYTTFLLFLFMILEINLSCRFDRGGKRDRGGNP